MSLRTRNLVYMARKWDEQAQNGNRENYAEYRYRAFRFRQMARESVEGLNEPKVQFRKNYEL